MLYFNLLKRATIFKVKNLRSQVSRAAIYTLGDMYTCLEKHMDLVSF